MAFFRNRTVNLLNLHTAISMIALTGGGAFFAVYLLKAGVGVPGVLLAEAAIFLGRLVMRSVVIVVVVRTGLRALVVIGAVALAAQFPLVAEVDGIGPALYWLIFISALGDTIYWPSYHAYYASLGDEEHRGHQISIREALTALVSIASPLVAGWLLVSGGPRLAFGVTAAIQVLSAVPLLWTPNVVVARAAPGAIRAALPGFALFATDGWISAGYMMAWQIALFFVLGQSFLAFGGALAVAALAGALSSLLLGRHIDAGNGKSAVWLAYGAWAPVVVLRAVSLSHPAFAFVANALGALTGPLYTPVQMTAVYNLAKRSPCPVRFHIACEGGFDIGFATGCIVSALIVWAGYPLSAAILLSLIGGLAGFIILQRYYTALPARAVNAGAFEVGPATLQPPG